MCDFVLLIFIWAAHRSDLPPSVSVLYIAFIFFFLVSIPNEKEMCESVKMKPSMQTD